MEDKLHEYIHYYERHILQDVMPFWDSRCIDKEHGGYFTCFDRKGSLTDDNKYIWFQGRQLYVYALLYNEVEKREEWLTNARHGYEFLSKYAYAGNGRWNYILDRQGNVIEGTISIFSDFHVLHGLAEYLKAEGGANSGCRKILEESYDVLEANMFNPEFKDIYENTWSPVFIWHDMYLTCLATVEACMDILGKARTQKLLEECLDKIGNWFARDEYEVVFEAITRENRVCLEQSKGRFVNPGHMHESAWFYMEAGRRLDNPEIIKTGLKLADWANRVGEDQRYGGIISYADALGEEPEPIDWFKVTNSLWHEKVWWPNAEALACYAIAYRVSGGDKEYLERFERLHNFCKTYLYDQEFGEWYERTTRDGTVKCDAKGTSWKCAFHLVRALVQVRKALLESETEG